MQQPILLLYSPRSCLGPEDIASAGSIEALGQPSESSRDL